MKQLSSFAVLNVNGGDRVSFTYDEIDDTTGEIKSTNNKKSFFVVDSSLRNSIDAVRDYIRRYQM